jgi:hypothetical protein
MERPGSAPQERGGPFSCVGAFASPQGHGKFALAPFDVAPPRNPGLNGYRRDRQAVWAEARARKGAMIEHEYEYHLKVDRAQARAVLYGLGAAFLGYLAVTNERGLVLISHAVSLEKGGARIVFGILAGVCALAAAWEGTNVALRASLRQRIALTRKGLIVPSSLWSTREELIRYDSILDMKEFTAPHTIMLIRHGEGVFELRLDMLDDERVYGEIVHNLALLVRTAKAGVDGPTPGAAPQKPP